MTLLERPISSIALAGDHSIICFDCVDWDLYERLADARDAANQHFKITFSRGRMSIMSPSATHEHVKRFLGRMVEVADLEQGLNIYSFGSTTLKRKDLEVGMESDECYYVGREPHYEGSKPLDLEREPAPDLVIEIEISRHPFDKVSLYEQIGVREVWRYDGREVEINVAGAGGNFQVHQSSSLFPFFTTQILNRFVQMMIASGEPLAIRAFRDWLHETQSQI